MPPPIRAVIFDMDGTLLDSTGSVERCWDKLAEALGVDRARAPFAHGVPSIPTIAACRPDLSADDVVASLNWLRNPDNKLRLAPDAFNYVADVKKVDKYTVQVISADTFAPALTRLAVSLQIVPAKIINSYATFEEKAEYWAFVWGTVVMIFTGWKLNTVISL